MNNDTFNLWLFGLPCSGKTTIGDKLAKRLKNDYGFDYDSVQRLDGDRIRESLTHDLGFSEQDRFENVRRVSVLADMLSQNNVSTISSFITPFRKARNHVKDNLENLHLVWVHAPVEICVNRDVKGMYRKAEKGEITNFTGVNHPFQEPTDPDILIRTHVSTVTESVNKILNFLNEKGYLP